MSHSFIFMKCVTRLPCVNNAKEKYIHVILLYDIYLSRSDNDRILLL